MTFRRLTFFCLALLLALPAPSAAHPNHNQTNEAVEQEAEAHQEHGQDQGREMGEHHHHGGDADEQRPTTFSGRLTAWLGNMHPFAVHFPIALIPASWLALLIARRRGHAADAVRAVIVLAGLAAVVAVLLGWLNGGFALADPNPIKTAHRWIGTTLALLVGSIGLWAWRRPASVNGRTMPWALGATTLLLLIQGWLGAVLTHGMAHMTF